MGLCHGIRCVSEPGLVLSFRIVPPASCKDASFQNDAHVILVMVYYAPSSPCKAISSRSATRASRPPSIVDCRTGDHANPKVRVLPPGASLGEPCKDVEHGMKQGQRQPHDWTDVVDDVVVAKGTNDASYRDNQEEADA